MKTPIKFLFIDELFQAATSELQNQGASFALAGGLAASIYRSEIRTTQDVDFLLLTPDNPERTAKQIIQKFGLTPGIARQADLKGGPIWAKKRQDTPICIITGKDLSDDQAPGLDFILPSMPWFAHALERAQSNLIDFGFGEIPTMTLEDIIIAKLSALSDKSDRFKDLDDIQSIMQVELDLDVPYLAGQLQALSLVIPKSVIDLFPKPLRKISKAVAKKLKI